MVLMGIVLVLMKTIMVSTVCDGFYWWDVKSYWKNAQNTLQKILFKCFFREKLMVHNGILMEIIGISVIFSIGLLLFCLLCKIVY